LVIVRNGRGVRGLGHALRLIFLGIANLVYTLLQNFERLDEGQILKWRDRMV
jgi:hypothetical protein